MIDKPIEGLSVVVESSQVEERTAFEVAVVELADASLRFATSKCYATEEALRVAAIAYSRALRTLLAFYAATGKRLPEALADLVPLVPVVEVAP